MQHTVLGRGCILVSTTSQVSREHGNRARPPPSSLTLVTSPNARPKVGLSVHVSAVGSVLTSKSS